MLRAPAHAVRACAWALGARSKAGEVGPHQIKNATHSTIRVLFHCCAHCTIMAVTTSRETMLSSERRSSSHILCGKRVKHPGLALRVLFLTLYTACVIVVCNAV